jgi:hypothetical protein
MGKFTFLTSLLMNTAGFNKGIDQAKKETQAFANGVKEAGSTMKGAFGGVSEMFGGVGTQLSGIASVAMGGVSAFKKMIPAINGVKVAFISTGIGAIVVALGTAFAALASYLNGTTEGASKLNKIMAFAKGVFNAILQRVQLLGEAVSLVFEGKFGEAGKKLKEAFAGGLLKEAKEDATAMVGLAERENKLWKAKVDWKIKESELQIKLDAAKLKVEDREHGNLARQKSLVEAQKLQSQINEGRIGIATEELSIAKEKGALGNKSREDVEKETDLQVNLNMEKAKASASQKEMAAKQAEINNGLKTELDAKKKLNELDKVSTPNAGNLDFAKMNGIKPISLTDLAPSPQELSTAPTLFQTLWTNAIDTVSTSLLAGGSSFKEYAKNIKSAMKSAIGGFIAEGVAALVGNALKSAAKTPYGFLMAAPLAALAGGIAKTAFNSLIPNFATGGIVGGNSFSGDKVPAMVNSAEMILNRGQQGNLFKMLNGSSGGGELKARVSGSDLLFVMNNAQRQTGSYR